MDKTRRDGPKQPAREPRPGEGIRSLQLWQRLSEARRLVASDEKARRQLADDPAAFLRQLALDERLLEVLQQSEAPPSGGAARFAVDPGDEEEEEEAAGESPCAAGPQPAEPVVRAGGRISLRVL